MTYFSNRGTVRWVDIIQDLVDAYNHSRYSSIGMAQADVQKKDENRLWVRLFENGDTHLKPQIPQKAMGWASSHKKIFDGLYGQLDHGALYSESGGHTLKRD